ncbi:MAG: GntR family transcriptional regulator [Erysipelotrichaceae bacterium]|nr:GntR family transcriptional regulator [Erysipelotrichaceae bacterium]
MFLIGLQGKEPIYQQIKDQIIRFIQLGVLKKDEKLPSVRSLSEELAINPNTVQRAYAELERDGYIYTINKKGVFVALSEDVNERKIAISNFNNAVNEALGSGLSREELIRIINKEEINHD